MRNIFIFVLACLPTLLATQTLKALEKAADKSLAEKDYYSAMIYLGDAMELNPDAPHLEYKYAEVSRRFNAYDLAEKYYTKVTESKTANQYPNAVFWLAMTKKSLGKYDEAMELFGEFTRTQSPYQPLSRRARKELTDCAWAKNQTKNPAYEIEIEQLSKNINTDYSDFGAIAMGDTLYYSAHKYENKEDKIEGNRKISKNLYSVDGAKGRPLRSNFNDTEKLTAHTAFNPSGRRVYFNICNYINTAEIRCQLYYREKDAKNRWSKTAIKLPDAINDPNFTNTQPSVGYDSVAQKEILFFVSDRTGGKGGLDIWYAAIKKDGFGLPYNLSAINTTEDDLTPFYHNPSQTLYFSSEGHLSFGGYDVFKSKKSNKWSKPENLGKGINTSYHDIYYSADATNENFYLSSNRPGSFYIDESNKSCCYDIYKGKKIINEENNETEEEHETEEENEMVTKKPSEKSTSKGLAETPTEKPNSSKSSATNTTIPKNINKKPWRLEDFLPLPLYFDNDQPDRNTLRDYTSKTYGTTFWKYYQLKETYIKEFTSPLAPKESVLATSNINDFFEDRVRLGYDHLLLFSRLLLKRLEEGESVEIFIKGYTSPLAKSEYNMNLGKRRVSSLKNHFEVYKNGIFLDYIKDEKLVLTEVSFGETTAAEGVSDSFVDQRNSIYNIDAAQERRVEIVEVKRK